MRKVLILFLGMILFSCAETVSEEVKQMTEGQKKSIRSIDQLEQDILNLPMNTKVDADILRDSKGILIDSLLTYYRNYPKDTMAPVYLDKAHMLYSGMGDYKSASLYADMILKQYPNYVNRRMIIESQIVNYDIFITPRDPEKVKEYIELLLKEVKLTEEERAEYEARLQNIDHSILD